MNLIYIHKIGSTHSKNYIYEFIFGDNPDEAEGENWDEPSHSEPPYDEYITQIGVLKSGKIQLAVLHESEYFTYIDGAERVISLAWEIVDDIEYELEEGEKRMVFHYGETKESVEAQLLTRDLTLKYNGF